MSSLYVPARKTPSDLVLTGVLSAQKGGCKSTGAMHSGSSPWQALCFRSAGVQTCGGNDDDMPTIFYVYLFRALPVTKVGHSEKGKNRGSGYERAHERARV